MKIIIIPVSFCYSFFKNSASERFRCDWLLKHLPADKYDGTQDLDEYDVIIYQKAHNLDMIELSKKHRDKIQIFDETDPEFLFERNDFIKELAKNMTFVTTSTKAVANGFKFYYDKPSFVIPDRHEFDFYEKKKEHHQSMPALVWFGYAANFKRIEPLIPIIKEYGLELITICEKPVSYGEFIKWDLITVNEEILKGDIVLNLPDEYGYKSNNKSTTGYILGLPVVEKVSDLFRFLDPIERVRAAEEGYKDVMENYNIKQSAEEIKELIKKFS